MLQSAKLVYYIISHLLQLMMHDFSIWCGWHNDHGSFTELISAMFVYSKGNIIENTDANAGKNNIFLSFSDSLSRSFTNCE